MSINQSTYNCPAGRRFNLDRHQIGMSDFLRRNPHGAITYPNQKEYARTAIQSFSLAAEERHIYTHTGWRKVDGQRLFLNQRCDR
jgi:hypothetical protein